MVTAAPAAPRRLPPATVRPTGRTPSTSPGFTDGAEVFRVSTTVTGGDVTELPALEGRPAAGLVVPNAGDLTWARVRLDDGHACESLPGQLAQVPDEQARAVVWSSLIDGVCLVRSTPAAFLDVFEAAWPAETNSSILTRVAASSVQPGRPPVPPAGRAARRPPSRSPPARPRCSSTRRRGSTTALVAARAPRAASSDDEALLRRWADGEGLPAGLDDDADFRWIVVRNLAASGAIGRAGDRRRARPRRHPAGRPAGAAAPRPPARTRASKAWAWEQLTADRGRSNYEMNELAARLLDRPGPRRGPPVRAALLHRRAGDGAGGWARTRSPVSPRSATPARWSSRPRSTSPRPRPGARRPDPGGPPRARGRRLRAGRGGALAGAVRLGVRLLTHRRRRESLTGQRPWNRGPTTSDRS